MMMMIIVMMTIRGHKRISIVRRVSISVGVVMTMMTMEQVFVHGRICRV